VECVESRQLLVMAASAGARQRSAQHVASIFRTLGLEHGGSSAAGVGASGVFWGEWAPAGGGHKLVSLDPTTGEVLGTVTGASEEDLERCVAEMSRAKSAWAAVPMPKRGEVVRLIGEGLREKKGALGALVSLEMGKILSEGEGEVQEAIDICDYTAGISRYAGMGGSIIPSERADHFMMERWNPLKQHCGIVTAFNFPVAVYFWNLALSLMAGNASIWKPAPSTPLVSIACTNIVAGALERAGHSASIASMACGGADIGESIVKDPRMELVSFTGSCKAGRRVGTLLAERFARSLLELGGNNAMIVLDDADMDLALRACLFSAVGTAGQRCTTLRRLLVQESAYDSFVAKLSQAYGSITVGDPMDASTLCGPLHTSEQVRTFRQVLAQAAEAGGKLLAGGGFEGLPAGGNFVRPALVEMPHWDSPLVMKENFVPVLYVMKVKGLDEAILANNSVPQGLSSSLFTRNQAAIFKWTGPAGSDCGIQNVNIGPSGAEIGGAFGGDKETGGGRESGSDAWKAYMRRSTCTINHGTTLPLAQGVEFNLV
jgi:aldehyde dehydrogenase family 7 protein A1